MIARVLALTLAVLAIASPSVRAADLALLDVPGAVHLKPGATAPPRTTSGFSVIPPASAAPMGTRANVVQVPAMRLTGYLMPGDASKMREMLDTLASYPAAKGGEGPLSTIEMSSLGGSLMEGFEIGSILRKYKMLAVVRARDLCLSSCALALVGGNVQEVPQSYPTRCNVEIGGKVGFHNFFLNPAALRDSTPNDAVASRMQGFADARGGAAALVKYAAQMGLPSNFVASLIGRPADDFQYIETVGQFLAIGVCPVGLTRPPVSIEDQAKNVCANSMRHADLDPEMEVRPLPAQGVKRFLLEKVQQQMQTTRARGRLSALLANGGVMRVAEEIDKLYDDLWSAGIAIPEIVGPAFEVRIKRSTAFEPACYVSLSPDDPDNFDVVVTGPRGLAEPPHLPPENARRLFLFDKKTVINPRPR